MWLPKALARTLGPNLERMGLHRRELYYKQRRCISVYWSWSPTPSNHHSKSWRYKHRQPINRAKLARVAAALKNEHTHIATDSASALWQKGNSILFPQSMKRLEHAKLLLETIVQHIQLSKDIIHLYMV